MQNLQGMDSAEELITSDPGEVIKRLTINWDDPFVLLLFGEVGTGKTTFVKLLLRSLGIIDGVDSPTFSLVNVYKDAEGREIIHTDWYRIQHLEELWNAGIEEYLESASRIIIEWPEVGLDLIKRDVFILEISHLPSAENQRKYRWGYRALD